MLTTAGCTATEDAADTTPEAEPRAVAPPEPRQPGSAAPERRKPGPAPRQPDPEPHPISVAALIHTDYTGGRLRVGEVLDETGSYMRYAVTYRSQGLRSSGIMNVPSGRGPFPVLILNHGYIDPEDYVTGQGLAREQDWLARQGYVVLHTDYRNHARSDDDPNVDYELRLPYAVDVINAVRAVKRSNLRYLDGNRVGLLGRSMGA